MTEKKISFGFKQIKKQPLVLPIRSETTNKNDDRELIKCLEGQTIKVFNEKIQDKPLVIPLKNNQKTSSALASLQNIKKVLDGDDECAALEQNDTGKESAGIDAALTIEQRVVKELLADAKNAEEGIDDANAVTLTLPLAADQLQLDGAIESTFEEYEQVPIAQYGWGMLRGMGVKDEDIKASKSKEPELRPKGMGLGADKLTRPKKLLVAPAPNEILEIKKNACVRILAGKYKDLYGQIEGLDDHAGRIIVKLALGGNRETLNEFMVQPVSKQEFSQYGKVINSAKYDEYKKKQEKMEEMKVKQEKFEEMKVKPEYICSIKQEHSNSKSDSLKCSSRSKRSTSNNREGSSNRNRNTSRKNSRERNRSVDRHLRRSLSPQNRRSQSTEDSNQRSKDIERSKSKSQRSENRQSCSRENIDRREDRNTSRSKDNRSRYDDKRAQRPNRSQSSDSNYSAKSSNSNSLSDSASAKRHHKSHSSKKHKRKSYGQSSSRSRHYQSDHNDRHLKKKTKKSKRQRSRSRQRK